MKTLKDFRDKVYKALHLKKKVPRDILEKIREEKPGKKYWKNLRNKSYRAEIIGSTLARKPGKIWEESLKIIFVNP